MTAEVMYLLIGAVFGLSYLVKWWLKRTYSTWSKVPNTHGITGAQAAAAILQSQGINHVRIESVRGKLTDHYDPGKDILRLSASNYNNTSVAAMAVSAHEAGHAIQDARNDIRLRLRKYLVPLASLGTRFGPMVFIGGAVLGNTALLQIGVLLFAGTMIFQVATLPVEFNASRRALRNLERLGLADPLQRKGVQAVLRAAALTYVAAAVTSIAYLATLLIRRR